MTVKEFYDWLGKQIAEHGEKEIWYIDTSFPKLDELFISEDETSGIAIH